MLKNAYTICAIGGDGIGPEVTAQTMRLLENIGLRLQFVEKDAGFSSFEKTGHSLPQDTIEQCKCADAILFGAVTTPPHIDDYSSPIIQLRKTLDLFANVRPFFSLPYTGARSGIDFTLVRENTEDLYSGIEEEIPDGFAAKRIITRRACERIIHFAFALARSEKRQRVTAVHKANVLRRTDGLFLQVAGEIAKNYPDIVLEDMLVDSTAMRLIKDPEHFSVIVTTNMFGDILSDEAAMLVGGLGVAASANIGDRHGLFEPVHGSAPKHAGKNSANPLGSFFSAVLLLEFLGETETARTVKQAIMKTVASGCTTPDIGGNASMSEVTDTVISFLK